MFSPKTDANKVALAHWVERLRRGGLTLLDTQFLTDHLTQFGRDNQAEYLSLLRAALATTGDLRRET